MSGAEGPERSEMEAAWLPFEKLSRQNADGQAEAKLAAEKAAAKQAAVKAARDAQPAASDSDRKGDNA